MACSECRGYGVSYCPICSPEPTMIVCPTCGGKGTFHYAYDIENDKDVECTGATYECLPENEDIARSRNQHYCKGYFETCEVCDGTGEIEYEPDYEPDYDE